LIHKTTNYYAIMLLVFFSICYYERVENKGKYIIETCGCMKISSIYMPPERQTNNNLLNGHNQYTGNQPKHGNKVRFLIPYFRPIQNKQLFITNAIPWHDPYVI